MEKDKRRFNAKNPKKIMNDALKNITQRNSHRNLISPAPSRKEMELIYQAALRKT